MQPYQEADESIKHQRGLPIRALKTAANVGAGAIATATAYGGGKEIFKRAIPFLSKYIPQDLAIKGLSKVDPRLGKFIDVAMDAGNSFEEAKNFIQEKIEGSKEQSKEQPKEDRNVIQQYSPELHQFISDQISGGRNALQAGSIAQHDKRFMKIIDKLSKDHQVPWSNILESVYGSQGQAQSQDQPQAQAQQEVLQGQGPGEQRMLNLLSKRQRRQ